MKVEGGLYLDARMLGRPNFNTGFLNLLKRMLAPLPEDRPTFTEMLIGIFIYFLLVFFFGAKKYFIT